MTTVHKLKTLCQYWDAVDRGEKLFEVRNNDRSFQKGDLLILEKYDGKFYEPDYSAPCHPPKRIRCEVTYVLGGGRFGIDAGYVVMGIKKLPELPKDHT